MDVISRSNKEHRPTRSAPDSIGPRIYWHALATGSLIGIAGWALLYVLGAALACTLGIMPTGASMVARTVVGGYGCIAASIALAAGSYSAARTGGAYSQEHAVFYGLCLWGMSTITLVTLTFAALAGCFASMSIEGAAFVDVGLAAVGLQAQMQKMPAPVYILSAMALTLVVSLVFSVRGAQAALWCRKPDSQQT